MADTEFELRRINWSEAFAFTRLFNGFRVACQPSRMIVALIGVLAVFVSGVVLDFLTPSSYQPVVVADSSGNILQSELDVWVNSPLAPKEVTRKWIEDQGPNESRKHAGVFSVASRFWMQLADGFADAATSLNPKGMFATLEVALAAKMWLLRMHWIFAILVTIAWLSIGALCGGAICRMAAIDIARGEQIGIGEGFAFAKGRFISFFGAPLFPTAIVAVLGLFLAIGGLIGVIPWLGEIIVGLIFFVALAIGFLMALVATGALAGAWMMYPAIAVEGVDFADAFARSLSYLYNRPWRTAFYGWLSIIYGMLCLYFVNILVRIMLILVHVSVGATMNWGGASVPGGGPAPSKLDAIWQPPDLAGLTPLAGTFGATELSGTTWLAAWLIRLWVYVVIGVVFAFAVSLFYSMTTQIFFLLRHVEDGTDFEDIYLDEFDREAPATVATVVATSSGNTSLPVVGSP